MLSRENIFFALFIWQTIFTFMIDFYDILPDYWKPNIGISKCWFESKFWDYLIDQWGWKNKKNLKLRKSAKKPKIKNLSAKPVKRLSLLLQKPIKPLIKLFEWFFSQTLKAVIVLYTHKCHVINEHEWFMAFTFFNDNKHRIIAYIIVFIAIIVYCWAFPYFSSFLFLFIEQSSPGHLIFFLLPIGIQISINFVLFVLTAIHCNRIKAEIHRMQASDCSDQQKKRSFIADKAMWVNPFTLLHLIACDFL
jgi:hypothetical protein